MTGPTKKLSERVKEMEEENLDLVYAVATLSKVVVAYRTRYPLTPDTSPRRLGFVPEGKSRVA